MAFKEELKRRRLKKGLSLKQLADKIKVSKAHIWDLEQGRATNPSLEVLKSLSTVLDVPIASLVGESPTDGAASEEAVVMYRDLTQLDEVDRETIKLVMERLKQRSQNSGE